MLSAKELEDLRDETYRASLEKSFRKLRECRGSGKPELMDLDTLIDWMTFMSDLTDHPHRWPFSTTPGRMRL